MAWRVFVTIASENRCAACGEQIIATADNTDKRKSRKVRQSMTVPGFICLLYNGSSIIGLGYFDL